MEFLAKMLIRRIDKSQHITDILSVMDDNSDNKGNAKKLRLLADALDKIEENIPF